mmetsp:Transcript_3067/g.7114  ORF Transcript_3067/g.7114 Transcript_3067/m.7114 type:complete len:136 (-) Transcript_3067:1372-1779(-)
MLFVAASLLFTAGLCVPFVLGASSWLDAPGPLHSRSLTNVLLFHGAQLIFLSILLTNLVQKLRRMDLAVAAVFLLVAPVYVVMLDTKMVHEIPFSLTRGTAGAGLCGLACAGWRLSSWGGGIGSAKSSGDGKELE